MNRIYYLFLILLILANTLTAQKQNPSVFYTNQGKESQWLGYQNNNKALYHIILNEAMALLDTREARISGLRSATDWQSYQLDLKKKMFSSLSKFTKTPLNPNITGKLERETYEVEKIIFESHPGFYVTGCLFIPKKRMNPAPAIIYCSGHTELAFRYPQYQKEILNLVNKGFIVFGLDPIGQGERLQYCNPETGKSKAGGPTTEHSYAGIQTLITGTSLTDYFIWDGVRVIDYLETRPEIDSKRIGITGRSGGGTQSAMIAAYDSRIAAAAPECYITSFKRLLQSIGPQDAEQNPYEAIKNGFDHADFLHLRAPKPTLMVTTTHDFFSIQGARESYAEGMKSFTAFGKPDNLKMVEDFGVHESTVKNRMAIYSFFQKPLNLPGDNEDSEIEPIRTEELWITQTGQVATSMNGETVFSLNLKYYHKENINNNSRLTKVKEITGVQFNQKLTSAIYTGKLNFDEFEVEKYFLENSKNDYALPVYKMISKSVLGNKTLIWQTSEGKEKLLENNLLKGLLKAGFVVYSADLPGNGELKDTNFRGDGFVKSVPFNYTFGANLVGKSITSIQAEALDLLVQFVTKNKSTEFVYGLADEGSSDMLLHFEVLKNSLKKIILLKNSESYMDLIQSEYYNPSSAYTVLPGSLKYYDIKDLITLLPKESAMIINVNNNGMPFKIEEILDFFD